MLGRPQNQKMEWVCSDDCVHNGVVGGLTAVALTKVYSSLNGVDVPLPITLEAGAITGASVAVSDMVLKSQPRYVKAFSPVLTGGLLAGAMALMKNDKAYSLWFPLGVVSHLVGKRLSYAYKAWDREQAKNEVDGIRNDDAVQATLSIPQMSGM